MKNVLIKLGGSVITDDSYRRSIVKQLIEIKQNNLNPCIVHGGGKLITYYMEKLGIKTEFFEGLRITNEQARDIVLMALSKVNKDLVYDFNSLGDLAIGICGGDANLIYGEKITHPSGKYLGYVATPTKVNTDFFKTITKLGYTIIISSIGLCEDGYYNINADHSAAIVAQQTKADHLIYVSDVSGVLHPETNEHYPVLTKEKIKSLQKEGIITAGMIPKLNSCLESLEKGVKNVCIINGKEKNSLCNYLINNKLAGTKINLNWG